MQFRNNTKFCIMIEIPIDFPGSPIDNKSALFS